MRDVFVVSYFYPDGTYAGILGIYDDEIKADATVSLFKLTDYPDCTFVITQSEIE